MRFKKLIGEQEIINQTPQKANGKLTKFAKLIRSYNLNEQTAEEINAAAAQDAALDPNAAATQAAQAQPVEAPQEQPVETLTPEGEVELIRLLRKALLLDVQANSVPLEIIDTEINQDNAREMYNKIKTFMSTFTT